MATTAVSYFKRYKMEVDLHELPPPALPPGFRWLPWGDEQLAGPRRGPVRELSPGNRRGGLSQPGQSRRLRHAHDGRQPRLNFLAEATWLAVGPAGPCGAIQGLHERGGVGAIQNVGVAPPWRGRGIGEALVLQALHGFRRAGLGRGLLEVTAQNEIAQRLYRRLGFRRTRTLYKAVPETMNDE